MRVPRGMTVIELLGKLAGMAAAGLTIAYSQVHHWGLFASVVLAILAYNLVDLLVQVALAVLNGLSTRFARRAPDQPKPPEPPAPPA